MPVLGVLVTVMTPPCAARISRTTYKPSPVPSDLVVWKGTNSWDSWSTGIPSPVSCTARHAQESACRKNQIAQGAFLCKILACLEAGICPTYSLRRGGARGRLAE